MLRLMPHHKTVTPWADIDAMSSDFAWCRGATPRSPLTCACHRLSDGLEACHDAAMTARRDKFSITGAWSMGVYDFRLRRRRKHFTFSTRPSNSRTVTRRAGAYFLFADDIF